MAVIIALYLVLTARFFTPGCKEPDTAGYLWMAEHIAEGRLPVTQCDDPLLYQSHVWVETSNDMIAAKFSPGLPVAMAIGMRLAGEAGAFAVSPAAGVLALIGAYVLFSMWMSRGASIAAVCAVAVTPAFLLYTQYPLTHALNTALIIWGVVFLRRWLAHPGAGNATGAGLLLGLAATVRATSVLMLLPALIIIFQGVRNRRVSRARILTTTALFAAMYSIAPLANAWYNKVIFGSPWLTGYALSDEQSAFTLGRLVASAGWTFGGIGTLVGAPVFGLGLLGMAAARGGWEKAFRFAWWVPLWLVLASYYWSFPYLGLAFLRFFLCLTPVFIGSGFELIDRFSVSGKQRVAALSITLGAILLTGVHESSRLLHSQVSSRANRVQAATAALAARNLPDNAVVFAAPPAAFRLGHGKGFTLYDLTAFDVRQQRRRFHNPSQPRQQKARKDRLLAFYRDHSATQLDELLRDRVEQALARGDTVAYLIPASQGKREQQRLGSSLILEPIASWQSSSQNENWQVYIARASVE